MTRLLHLAAEGDGHAAERLFAAVYDELRALRHAWMQCGAGACQNRVHRSIRSEEDSMEAIEVRKVPIRPFDCLSKGHELTRDRYWLFVGICAVGTLLASLVPMGILAGPLMCGIYLCLFAAEQGREPSFDLLFRGFDHFVESLIATLIVVAASLVLIIPFYFVFFVGLIMAGGLGSEGEGGFVVLTVAILLLLSAVLVALLIALGVVFSFVYPLIVDRHVTAIPALRLSWQAAKVNFWGVFGLLLLVGVLTTVASLFCYVPVFLVLPACLGAMAVAYRKVFG